MIGNFDLGNGQQTPAQGHSGAGVADCCAVYHFPGAPKPMTLVAFEVAENEFGCENAVAREASKLFLSP